MNDSEEFVVNASKEAALEAITALNICEELYGESPDFDTIRDFLEAAKEKLPTEESYHRAQRRRKKTVAKAKTAKTATKRAGVTGRGKPGRRAKNR
jgi:cell division protein ZapA (FtsZ GTPase activity inhibitor)